MSDSVTRQPRQRYEPKPNDPTWLVESVRLHGHLGPWAALGVRIGQAALADLDCEGYFDIDVTVRGPIAKPPPRCIVDGLQFGTGATLGKDSMHIELTDDYEIIATNTKTQQAARYQPAEAFLSAVKQMDGHDQVEALARRIAVEPLEAFVERVT